MSSFDHARSFGAGAAAYAAARPSYPPALYDWIASQAPARAFAIDVAAGAGQGTLGLLRTFDRVLALDPSEALLAAIPASPGLRTQVGTAESLSASAAHALTVHQALHWFAGEPFWSRVQAALAPGGLFVVVWYAWFTVDPAVDEVVSTRLLPRLAPYWSARNQLLMNDYRAVEFPFPEVDAPRFVLEPRWTREALWAYVETWSAAAAVRAAEGATALDDIAQQLAEVWPDDTPRVVTMPLGVRAFRRASRG